MKGTILLRMASVTTAGAVCVALALPSSVQAASISVDFPSSTSFYEINPGLGSLETSGSLGSGSPYAWGSGSYISQTFSGTGLANANGSRWTFSMIDYTASNVNSTFDLLINAVKVGDFSFTGNNFSDQQRNFDLSFLHSSPIAGDTYKLEILATSTAYDGGGSWRWLPGGSVTLESSPTLVPTPALLPGLIGMGVMAWRKRRAEVSEEA